MLFIFLQLWIYSFLKIFINKICISQKIPNSWLLIFLMWRAMILNFLAAISLKSLHNLKDGNPHDFVPTLKSLSYNFRVLLQLIKCRSLLMKRKFPQKLRYLLAVRLEKWDLKMSSLRKLVISHFIQMNNQIGKPGNSRLYQSMRMNVIFSNYWYIRTTEINSIPSIKWE